MPETIAEIVLTEVRQLRGDLCRWQLNMEGRLSSAETTIEAGLIGNPSAPSRMLTVENKVDDLRRKQWFTSGAVAAASSVLTLAGGYVMRTLFGK